MAREFFKNLPSQETPFNAQRWNGLLNGEEAMGSIVVDDITCKNIFDKNNVYINKALNDGDGTVFEATNRNTTDFIVVKPNSNYIFSNISRTAVCLYDENKKFIKTFQNNLITTTSNTYYIRFTYKTDEDYSKGQLEKGSVATDYVEHKEYDNKEVYSTNEQVIGTWIDGKPLYRKVVQFTNSSTIGATGTSTEIPIAHGISNLGRVIECKLNNVSNQIFPRAGGSSSVTSWTGITNVTSTGITLFIINDTWGSRTWYITLEYTKTTD